MIAKQVLESPENFVLLPGCLGKRDLDIMERFRESVEGPVVSEALSDALNRGEPVGKFRNVILKFGFEQDWFDFRNLEYEKTAKTWCINHQINYQQEKE